GLPSMASPGPKSPGPRNLRDQGGYAGFFSFGSGLHSAKPRPRSLAASARTGSGAGCEGAYRSHGVLRVRFPRSGSRATQEERSRCQPRDPSGRLIRGPPAQQEPARESAPHVEFVHLAIAELVEVAEEGQVLAP